MLPQGAARALPRRRHATAPLLQSCPGTTQEPRQRKTQPLAPSSVLSKAGLGPLSFASPARERSPPTKENSYEWRIPSRLPPTDHRTFPPRMARPGPRFSLLHCRSPETERSIGQTLSESVSGAPHLPGRGRAPERLGSVTGSEAGLALAFGRAKGGKRASARPAGGADWLEQPRREGAERRGFQARPSKLAPYSLSLRIFTLHCHSPRKSQITSTSCKRAVHTHAVRAVGVGRGRRSVLAWQGWPEADRIHPNL